MPDDATGNVTVSVNGENYTAPVNNGQAIFNITGLGDGEYIISADYEGDAKYLPSSDNGTFKVSKIDIDPVITNSSSLDVERLDNGTVIVNVTVPDDATGNVTVSIDNETITVPVVNGTAVVDLGNLSDGNHTVNISYSGDDKYGGFNESAVINDNGIKYNPTMSVDSDKDDYVAGELQS